MYLDKIDYMSIQDVISTGNYTLSPLKLVIAGDGGTVAFELTDLDREIHHLFIDRRIGTTNY